VAREQSPEVELMCSLPSLPPSRRQSSQSARTQSRMDRGWKTYHGGKSLISRCFSKRKEGKRRGFYRPRGEGGPARGALSRSPSLFSIRNKVGERPFPIPEQHHISWCESQENPLGMASWQIPQRTRGWFSIQPGRKSSNSPIVTRPSSLSSLLPLLPSQPCPQFFLISQRHRS